MKTKLRKVKLNKKQALSLLIIFGLLLTIPLGLALVKQRQEIRKKAAGSYEVDLRLDPSSGEKAQGETFTVNVKLSKNAQREIKISGAEVVLQVSEKLTINSVSCASIFDGLKVERIDNENNKITLMCTINLDSELITLSTIPLALGAINFSVKSDASEGEAAVSFEATRVTEAGIPGQAPDVSSAGETATYTIIAGVSPTPSPTTTLSPTFTLTPIPSIGPTLTITPTQTVTPTPSGHPCPTEALGGDYDCSGVIDEKDFSNPEPSEGERRGWKEDFLEGKTSLRFFEYWRRTFFK